MKYSFLLICLLALTFCSCSHTMKITQTPDDVYYSPVQPIEENNNKNDNYQANNDDRQIIMSRHDNRWRDFDGDYNWQYDPYHYGYNYGYYYNPYYSPYPVFTNGYGIVNPKNNTIRTTNLGSYTFHNVAVVNPKTGPVQLKQNGRRYNNSNNNNAPRNVIMPSNNSNSGSNNNTRTYSPNNSSNSSGSTNSGTPVTRPKRGQ